MFFNTWPFFSSSNGMQDSNEGGPLCSFTLISPILNHTCNLIIQERNKCPMLCGIPRLMDAMN